MARLGIMGKMFVGQAVFALCRNAARVVQLAVVCSIALSVTKVSIYLTY